MDNSPQKTIYYKPKMDSYQAYELLPAEVKRVLHDVCD
jgi:hypothetical protein